MNVNSVTSLLPSYLLPFNSTANTVNARSASSVQQQADVLGLSPAAGFLNQLQQLQTQSLQQFQALISQLTGQLQKAATTANNNGKSAQAGQLTQLAKSFQNAATGGALPTAQQLQQAGIIGHRPLHTGRGYASTSDTQNQSLIASMFGSVTPQHSATF
jgi:hypothetical protein